MVGEGVRKKSSKAIQLMKRAVEQGHVDAMFSLAMYYRGDEDNCVAKDTEQMMYYLVCPRMRVSLPFLFFMVLLQKLAADNQLSKAQRLLGYAYKDGHEGTFNDRNLAMHYFQLASEQGDTVSELELLSLQDEKQTEEVETTPENADEIFLLGVRYREGEDGIEQDAVEALRLFRIAADRSHPHALYLLACAYRDGGNCHNIRHASIDRCIYSTSHTDCVNQDYVEAARLFQLAADKAFPEAEYELAFCYYSSQGLEYDLSMVCHCYLGTIRMDCRASGYVTLNKFFICRPCFCLSAALLEMMPEQNICLPFVTRMEAMVLKLTQKNQFTI